MYAASASLYSINEATHTPTAVGSLGSIQFGGLTIHPKTNVLHGSVAGATTTTVYRVCCATAQTGVARTFPVGNMRAIAFNPHGELYGASTSGRLYRLNLATGDTVGIGTAPGVAYGSIAFSPSGKLWASVNSGASGRDKIYTVDTTTGAATLVGSTGDNTFTPAIFVNPDGTVYGLKAISTRLPNIVISIDTVTGKGDSLFSTGMKGITSMTMLSFLVTGVAASPDPVPTSFRLGQNYPNPFNPTTEIRYQVSGISNVTLAVYDLLGREVAVLVNERKTAGSYSVRFDGSGLASGVYFYRMQAGDFVQARRLILIK
jgi:WD40 repeat protein